MSRLIHGASVAVLMATIAFASPTLGRAATRNAAPDTAPPQTIPESTEPGKSGTSSGPLSDKLDRTGGVIHPPDTVDPGMNKSPPPAGPGSTPIIPPPGTPGSDSPGVEPK